MKTKTCYVVSMAYCCGRLGMSEIFDRYSDAKAFALNAKEDKDNTYITIDEITKSGIFKKKYETKTLETYNEE
jgi:hypothetical protein